MAVNVKGLSAAQIKKIAAENAAAEAKAKAEREAAMTAEIEALRAANLILATQVKENKVALHGITMKVAEKGGLSMYGLGRWPVTLYVEQWVRLAEVVKNGKLDSFIEAHRSELKTKEVV